MSGKLHPFERSGLGLAPFRWVSVISLPDNALAEANPSAHNLALAQAFQQARSLGVTLGSCQHCGMGLNHHGVIEDAEGTRFVVGLDCVAKTGDSGIGKRAEVEARRIRNSKARERAERKRIERHTAWLDSVCETGETNRDRLAREDRERGEAVKAERLRRERVSEILRPIWEVLEGNGSNFALSVAEDMRNGTLPRGRGENIAADIFAKAHGRRNSLAYSGALDNFMDIIESLEGGAK